MILNQIINNGEILELFDRGAGANKSDYLSFEVNRRGQVVLPLRPFLPSSSALIWNWEHPRKLTCISKSRRSLFPLFPSQTTIPALTSGFTHEISTCPLSHIREASPLSPYVQTEYIHAQFWGLHTPQCVLSLAAFQKGTFCADIWTPQKTILNIPIKIILIINYRVVNNL